MTLRRGKRASLLILFMEIGIYWEYCGIAPGSFAEDCGRGTHAATLVTVKVDSLMLKMFLQIT